MVNNSFRPEALHAFTTGDHHDPASQGRNPRRGVLPRPSRAQLHRSEQRGTGDVCLGGWGIPGADATPTGRTEISFEVADIVAEIAELEENGVVFADYDLPGLKTVEHVCVLGSEKAAWFEDPDGNVLCLHEMT